MEILYVYVQSKDKKPLMPTTRYGKVKRMLRSGAAIVVSNVPFTIRLTYEPKTKITQRLCAGIDPGRINIGVSVVAFGGKCVYQAHIKTRNKMIPILMNIRSKRRHESRHGERLKRKRRARKFNTIINGGSVVRKIPGYDKDIVVKDIINTEVRFNNRYVSEEWLTPTATQLLRTHVNIIKLIQKILPISDVCLEFNEFFGPNLNNQRHQFHSYRDLRERTYKLQNGKCLLCGKPIDQYHHIVQIRKFGSNSIQNIVGLCKSCHNLVHKNNDIKHKLNSIVGCGRRKKNSIKDILNSIMNPLSNELVKLFPEHTYITYGYYTKELRDEMGLDKQHHIDAYCIASTIFYDDSFMVDVNMPNIYNINQYRRQDRAIIQHITERTYLLDGVVVAKNRRKRFDQFSDSLHEWYIKMRNEFGIAIAKQLQSKLVVKKCKRHYNNMCRNLPGATFKYCRKLYVLQNQSTFGKTYHACGFGIKSFSSSKCEVILKNYGLVYIPNLQGGI